MSRCPRLLLPLTIMGVLIASPIGAVTWTGSTSTDWFNSANWSGNVPDFEAEIIIPSGASNYPVLNATGAECKTITIQSGATLDLASYTLSVEKEFDAGASNVLTASSGGSLTFFRSEDSKILSTFSFTGEIRSAKSGGASLDFESGVTCGDLIVQNGTVTLSAGVAHTITVNGNLSVASGHSIDRDKASVDVAGNVTINGSYDDSNATGSTSVGGNWTDTGTFTPGTNTVTFDGGGTSVVTVPGASDFYGLTITNSTTVQVASAIDINGTATINSGSILDANGDLDVTGGALTCAGTGRLQIGSTVTAIGTFTAGSGTVEYDSTAANQTLQNVTYNNLEIDKSSFTGTASGTSTVGGTTTITSGTLDIASTGDVTATGAISATGALSMTGAGTLRLGASVTVNSGGTFQTSGASSPTLTNNGAGDYTFTVASGGTVNVDGLNFSNSESTGLTINSGATITKLRAVAFTSIDPDADGTNDTFLRVLDSGSTSYQFVGLSFDSTCTYNVETASGTSINIRMVIPSGAKGTETYELEGTASSIDWPLFSRSWVGGTTGVETDWDEANNWSPVGVPTATDDCRIPNVTFDPILNATGHVALIYIDTGGSLTISATQTMELETDLVIHSAGTFAMSAGTLLFTGTGPQSINDEGGATVTVYHLTVNNASSVTSASSDLTVSGNLTVTAGTFAVGSATCAVTGTTDIDATVTVGTGTLDSNGTFDATGGAVTFSGAGRLQLGGSVTSLGTFTANASTVEYDDTGTNRTVLAGTYNSLEVDTSTRTASAGGTITVNDALTVTSGTLAVAANTITTTGASDINATVTMSTGTLDANGAFDATGGSLTFTGAGRLQLGGAVTSLGTLTPSTGTVEYDDTAADQTVVSTTYYNLETDNSPRIGTSTGAVTATNITITTGTLDVDGALNVTGNLTFSASGRLRIGGSVTSMGTFSGGTGTVEFDSAGAGQTIPVVAYYNLEVDNSGQVALTGGDMTVSNNVLVTAGELEIDDNDTLTVSGDVTAIGNFDVEPGATLALGNASSLVVASGGNFEALGSASVVATVTSSDTATPTRYSFTISAGGTIQAQYTYFRYMDSSGIQIVDSASVTAITQLGDAVFDNGPAAGTLLSITSNDNAVTLANLLFYDTNGSTYNCATSAATATVTIDPYGGGGFGGPANENDNGAGTVTPGNIVWGTQTPVTLDHFQATSQGRRVDLTWHTLAEWRCAGFWVEGLAAHGSYEPIHDRMIPAAGQPPDGASYGIEDTAGNHARYRLIEVDHRGGRRIIGWAAVSATRKVSRNARLRPPTSPSVSTGTSTSTAPITVPGPPPVAVGPVYVHVDQPGIVRLTQEQLQIAGFPVHRDPAEFCLGRAGEAIPLMVATGNDGRFDPGDAIYFEAAPFHQLENRTDSYLLSIGGGPALRMNEIDLTPSGPGVVTFSPGTQQFERNELYVLSLSNGAGRDHWFWRGIYGAGAVDQSFELPGVVAPGTASLRLVMESWTDDPFTDIDHTIAVRVNGVDVGELLARGAGSIADTFDVPGGVLLTGTNTLTLEPVNPLATAVLYLDRFKVTGPRWHIATGQPLRLRPSAGNQRVTGLDSDDAEVFFLSPSGASHGAGCLRFPWGTSWALDFRPVGAPSAFEPEYVVVTPSTAIRPTFVRPVAPSKHLSPPAGADFIAIGPAALLASAEPLFRQRQRSGLRVVAVPLEEIRDHFGAGQNTVESLRAFLATALEQWPAPAPTALLLVGDATYDPAGNQGLQPRQMVPTVLFEAPNIQSASDDLFGDPDQDSWLDLAVGRLPVATPAECEALVQKILDYEQASVAGPWRKRAVLVADNGLEFSTTIRSGMGSLPATLELLPVDLAKQPSLQAHQMLMAHWQRGATLVHYSGHGSRLQWNQVLHVDDVDLLTNGTRLPLVTAMNCLSGYFIHPGTPSIGEALVTHPDGGAIAYWGPTAITSNLGQQLLADRFHENLFDASILTIGEAVRVTKNELAEELPHLRPLLRTWVLLGDPTVRLR